MVTFSHYLDASPFFGGSCGGFFGSANLSGGGELGFGLVESHDAIDEAGDGGGELFVDEQGDLAGEDGGDNLLHQDSSPLLCHASSISSLCSVS